MQDPKPAVVPPGRPRPQSHLPLTAQTGIRRVAEVLPGLWPPEGSITPLGLTFSPFATTTLSRLATTRLPTLDAGKQMPRPARTTAEPFVTVGRLGHTLRLESRAIYLVSLGNVAEGFSPPPRTPEPWTPQTWNPEPIDTDSTSAILDVPRRYADATRLVGRPAVMRPAVRFPSLDPPASAHLVSEPSQKPRVKVNLGELAAQIAGSNFNLRALEAELHKPGEWNAEQLRPLVGRLEVLVIRQTDLGTFRTMVPERDRPLLGWLESPRRAIAEASARLFETRSRVSGQDFTGTETQRYIELRELRAMSSKLAELATKQ